MDVTELRKGLGYTQAELAHALDVSPGHVGDLERGRRKLSLPLAAKLERLTGKPLVAEFVAEKTRQS